MGSDKECTLFVVCFVHAAGVVPCTGGIIAPCCAEWRGGAYPAGEEKTLTATV